MYKLSVPLEAQSKSDTCWHASAFMIWRYWQSVTHRQGPMNTLANKWEHNKPIQPTEFIALAEKVGLIRIPTVTKQHSASELEVLLRKYGPIWCAGYWYGPGHIIVLTGVDGDTLFFNDPDGGVTKTGSVKWFNEKIASDVVGCMMAKDQDRY